MPADETYGDDDNLMALLGLSVETAMTMREAAVEAAKERHPSGLHHGAPVVPADAAVLTAADRCDAACSAAAVYRMRQGKTNRDLLFCGHHWRKHAPAMIDEGWKVDASNPDLIAEMYGVRTQGDDHA
jgi:hypothetical protein